MEIRCIFYYIFWSVYITDWPLYGECQQLNKYLITLWSRTVRSQFYRVMISHIILVVVTGTMRLVLDHLVKSLQLIEDFLGGTHRFHLRVPNLQMSGSNSTRMRGYQNTSPPNSTIRHTLQVQIEILYCINNLSSSWWNFSVWFR